MPANPFPVNKLFYSYVFFRKETPIRTNLENYKQTVLKAEIRAYPDNRIVMRPGEKSEARAAG